MRVPRLLPLLLLLLLPCTAAPAEMEVLFSAGGDRDKAIISLAKQAKSSIDAACYWFARSDIADELMFAANGIESP